MSKNRIKEVSSKGFAVIACLSLLSLLILLALAMVSLGKSSYTTQSQTDHLDRARANARLALSKAIAALQNNMGKDQAVCATVSIFETEEDNLETNIDESKIHNRNWLGAWKTTVSNDGVDWPVIGKRADNSMEKKLYSFRGIYEDLRYTLPDLRYGQWRKEMHQEWLVSGGETVNYLTEYDESDDQAILLVGKKTLGSLVSETADYQKEKVVVPAEDIKNVQGELSGRMAYWVKNNNLSALLTQQEDQSQLVKEEIMVSVDPSAVTLTDGSTPFIGLKEQLLNTQGAIQSQSSLELLTSVNDAVSSAYFDFTVRSEGLHTNVQLGGFKKDLTPVLFGDKSERSIVLEDPILPVKFSSSNPIISGRSHAVIGPSFDGLRAWGLHRYRAGLSEAHVQADVEIASDAKVYRDGAEWARSTSDGYALELSTWSAHAPKLNPVMLEASWFNGYSSSGEVGVDANMRFHLAPRVVLWNPYSVKVTMPELVVLMPNFFRVFKKDGNPTSNDNFRIKFYVEDSYAERLKSSIPEIVNWNKEQDSSNDFSIPGGGDYYYFHVNAKTDDVFKNRSWAPRGKYIGFIMEKTDFEPGQSLVFSADVGERGGAEHRMLSESNISLNKLSAYSKSGEDSFFLEPSFPGTEVKLGKSSASNPALDDDVASRLMQHMDFERIFRYRVENFPHLNPHASLKLADEANFDLSADEMITSDKYVSIQTINCGNGGTQDGQFPMNNVFADSRLFVSLANSEKYPELVDYPRRFQSGVKLSWFDESYFEANDQESYRLHPTDGLGANSVAFHSPLIAHGSVRPSIVTRVPHHFAVYNYCNYHAGNWTASFGSPSPSEVLELAKVDAEGRFTKNPFGASSQYQGGRAVMFDLPSVSSGCVSLTSLRHANISPFSWHPTYIIGNSLADLSAPADYSANLKLAENYNSRLGCESVNNFLDYYLGGTRSVSNANKYTAKRYWEYWDECEQSSVNWGAPTGYQSWAYGITNSESLLQIGKNETSKIIDGEEVRSTNEILTYDISFEVNQNLYDDFLLSGMPIDIADTSSFSLRSEFDLHNPYYVFNSDTNLDREVVRSKLNDEGGLGFGFWNNGYLLKSNCQFNVNSTSVNAWITILSGMRSEIRKVNGTEAEIGKKNYHLYSRVRKPLTAETTENLDAYKDSAYTGGRMLSDTEIRVLAKHIVEQVKLRGPFLSLADFVNRRLGKPAQRTDVTMASYAQAHATFDGMDDPTTRMGALEAAIHNSGINHRIKLNSVLEDSAYHAKNRSDGEDPYDVKSLHRGYATHVDWQPDYTYRQVDSKIWGAPSFLTQADILSPITPMLSVRGDTFTIRACGQSVEEGKVMAEAYIEAVVVRTPNYIENEGVGSNLKPALKIDTLTGEVAPTGLSSVNKKLGRRFKLVSFKWMRKDEI